jgi:hypothetical protein
MGVVSSEKKKEELTAVRPIMRMKSKDDDL